jgi:hypothetical protein
MKDYILEKFELAFDKAQNDTHDIEAATNECIEKFKKKYPTHIELFDKLVERKTQFYRNLPDIYENKG